MCACVCARVCGYACAHACACACVCIKCACECVYIRACIGVYKVGHEVYQVCVCVCVHVRACVRACLCLSAYPSILYSSIATYLDKIRLSV